MSNLNIDLHRIKNCSVLPAIMAAERQSLGHLLFITAMSTFFSTVVLVRMLFGIILKGPIKMFTVQRRAIRPDLLDDPKFGMHSFARLKASLSTLPWTWEFPFTVIKTCYCQYHIHKFGQVILDLSFICFS